jgi:two-component system, NarL family, nitrate/nitrite response regulator NarL
MDGHRQESQIGTFILSPIRIYREGLCRVLAEEPAVRVLGTAAVLADAVVLLEDMSVDVMLFDVATGPTMAGLRQLARYEHLRVIALGVVEDQDSVIACAEAGIAGYATPDSSLAELVQTIRAAARGDFSCPPHIAAGLLRRLAVAEPRDLPAPQARLTLREREIVGLIDRGLSNKEIARRLGIQLATVKNHVHNILDKLGVTRRADAAATLWPYRYAVRPGTPAATGARH